MGPRHETKNGVVIIAVHEIYSYYLDFYRLRMNWNQIHQELTEKEHYLIMTEHLFDFGVDYYYITRIPALESCWSESDIEYID